jgi:uncharacterized protein YceK
MLINGLKKYLFIAVSTQIAGCGTIFTQYSGSGATDPDHFPVIPRMYSGAYFDFSCAFHSGPPNNIELFCFIDLPMSMALDTVILPYTLYKQIECGSYPSKC